MSPTHPLRRLAVVDTGESAVRVLVAVAAANRRIAAGEADGQAVTTVLVHTRPDAGAWYAREADESVALVAGPGGLVPAEALVAALLEAGCDAVWVGRRVVADLLDLTTRCEAAGVVVVGPSAATIRLVGDRLALRKVAADAGVAVVEHAPAIAHGLPGARSAAAELGYPVVVWDPGASRRGAHRAADADDLAAALAGVGAAQGLRGAAALDDVDVFVERDLGPGRRVDVEVVADDAGTVWTLAVRDASVQRLGHRVLVESGVSGLAGDTVRALQAAAARVATAVGLRNAGAVQFLVTAGGEFHLTGVDARLQADHALTEEVSGLDVVALRLALAGGDLLVGPVPQPDGWAVEAYLFARDADADFTDAPGRIGLLALPAGTGVRVDAGVREGDVIAETDHPLLATITAWGRDRDEALHRLRRALLTTGVVVESGATDRGFLLAVAGRPELAAAAIDDRWLDTLVTAGGLVPPADPVALVAAAVEAYEADAALAEAAFYASAARGRPEQAERVGTQVRLGYRGAHYALRVDRTGPGRYEVRGGATAAVVDLERGGRYERRLATGARRHRLVVTPRSDAVGGGCRVEVDGIAHTVSREDGFVVRAGWPAFVVSLAVQVGDTVAAGDQVAVLESMKLESPVVTPVAGEVTSVEVTSNAQVDAGAPLLRVRAASGPAFMRGSGAAVPVPVEAVDLGTPARDTDRTGEPAAGRAAAPDAETVFAELSSYLLGYDLDPVTFSSLVTRHRTLGTADDEVADARLLHREDALLDLYADLAALYRPTTETVEGALPEAGAGTQEYLHAYLQWLDPDRAGLSEAYRSRLERALARYGVQGLRRTPALESAAVRLFRSTGRVRDLTPVVTAILYRRLAHAERLAPLAPAGTRARLDRLAGATQGRVQVVADLARDVRFHHLDEPVLEARTAQVDHDMESHLAALATEESRPDRDERIAALVACPQPLRGMLLHAWLTASDRGPDAAAAVRDAVLEVYVRRFYRIRDLRDLTLDTTDGVRVATAEYTRGEATCRLAAAYCPLDDLPAVLAGVGRLLAAVPRDRQVTVDLACWRDGERPEFDELLADVSARLAGLHLGRRLHRLDLTVTSGGGALQEHFRTQHLTFRQGEDGSFVEDPLYRNLHPMLAKRLDLWRLANFQLDRLASPEDIYLFLGVAEDFPTDRRLFALAEVRDLTPVTDPATGAVSYPGLERTGLQALSAIRGALAGLPDRRRPVANRIVLYVRPPWDVPEALWPRLARAFAPLAAGAGLEKVVLRVRIPDGAAPHGLREAVLHVEGLGGHGVSVREAPLGSAPVRPLDSYRQNVLLARRFGAPYPYEIVRMLAPEAGTAGRFPAGRFEELDLDGAGALVPVDRPPGANSAHVVVGLITNVTAAVPEGMTRVAILGDPTKGLGNLAEQECRRVNAALDLAERLRVPVEWFAVSSGALIAMDSGTENMDWISATLRRIIEFTQDGGEINIVVTGINVGGQPYWNAEATMLLHTRGILVMTPASAMVLTGKQALDFSGGVSAEDNFGIGGYDRVMGPNGQGQYWAPSFEDACDLLLAHYEHTYVVPGERFPRRRPTADPFGRDIRTAPHRAVPGSDFTTVGDVFDANPDRKKPFDMRSVMRAVADVEVEPLERWKRWKGGDTSIVWDTRVGGIPVCMLGLESRDVPRRGFVPADGPLRWTSGTLFPQASRKTARAVNSASGNRPLVVMANLSGFDGSPESMRRWQLEYGAEIGRAVTNFRGPIVFVVVSRYHGGAFVVFSKALNPFLEIAAVEGSFASVIGGAPAAATVFARDVKVRTEKDPRVVELRTALAAASGAEAATLRARLVAVTEAVRSEKLGEVADEFDGIHTIDRALRVGSVDRIIAPSQVREYVVDALERGMARVLAAGV